MDWCLVLSTMKKKMQPSKKTDSPNERPGEQLLEYPLALRDNDGKLLKGQKSYSTNYLQSIYRDAFPPIITSELPPG